VYFALVSLIFLWIAYPSICSRSSRAIRRGMQRSLALYHSLSGIVQLQGLLRTSLGPASCTQDPLAHV
jgi:hypothetical protein